MKWKSSKKSDMPRCVVYSRTFVKSWKRYNATGRYNINAATEVMALLYTCKPLPAEYLDHELKGSAWAKTRELHIGGDFLMLYNINEQINLLTFVDLGTHSELFR